MALITPKNNALSDWKGRCDLFVFLWVLFFDVLDEVADGVFEADDDLTVKAGEDAVDLLRIEDAFFDLEFVGQEADERNFYQSKQHAEGAHDDGVGEVEFFSRRKGNLHEGRFGEHTNEGEHRKGDPGDESDRNGGFGDLLTVQAVQEGSEEGSGERAPAYAHQRGDLADVVELLDDGDDGGDSDEDDEQDTHDKDLLFLGHFFFFNDVLFDKVERQRGRRSQYQSGQRGHGRREDENDDDTHEEVGRNRLIEHGGDDTVEVLGRADKQTAEAAQEVASAGDDDGEDGGNDGALFDVVFALYRVELTDHLRQAPRS